MEMTNMTAGGPSYGLLDLLFGKKPKEEPGDGKGFGPLLNLMKALKEKAEEATGEKGWTKTETEAGKKGDEYPGMMLPAAYVASSQNVDLMKVAPAQDGMVQLTPAQLKQLMQGKINAMQGQAPMQAAEQTDEQSKLASLLKAGAAEEPMEVFRAKDGQMVPMKLSPEEMQEISKALDGRIKDLARQILAKDSQQPVEGGKERALAAAMGLEAIQSDAAKKQLNLKGAEVVAETQPKAKKPDSEKLFTTEDFLQVKDSKNQDPKLNAAQAKHHVQAQQPEMKAEVRDHLLQQNAPKPAAAPEQSGQVASMKPQLAEQVAKSHPRKSKSADDLEKGIHSLSGDLAPKAAAGLAVRDVFMHNVKPDQVRGRLIGEVAESVSLQAKNGGGEMKLVIHPDNLGELKLKVETKDGKVQVAVTADNNDVAQSLRASQNDLRDALHGQHLTLSKFEVNVADNSSMASNQDNSGGNYQGSFFQDNGDRSNNGAFSDQYARDNAPSYRDENFRMGDSMMPKPRAATQYVASNNGKSRLDVVA